MLHPDDIDTGYGPRLWDADPDVCCAARQLGACSHTEAFDEEYDLKPLTAQEQADLTARLAVLDARRNAEHDTCPF